MTHPMSRLSPLLFHVHLRAECRVPSLCDVKAFGLRKLLTLLTPFFLIRDLSKFYEVGARLIESHPSFFDLGLNSIK